MASRKRIYSIGIAFILAVLVVFIGFGMTAKVYADSEYDYENPDTGYKAVIIDESDILDDAEERDVVEHMKDITEYGNAVFFITEEDNGDTSSPYIS